MVNSEDWIMHAKATKSMATRALLHGEVEASKKLFQSAQQMESEAARLMPHQPRRDDV